VADVLVVDYDPAWPAVFEAEKELLADRLALWLDGGIHHIGSTAIPGLAAKPLIDMMAGVRDLDEASAAFEPLARLGYVSTPHRPGIAHHFSKPATGPTRFGLHLTEPGSDLWRERLAFRDSLRGDPALAAEYESLKRRLAEEYPNDPAAYTTGKRTFVASVLAGHGIAPGRR
jgi:GrpB-like predicted nucleotidyltransferase (UPF0157 family)